MLKNQFILLILIFCTLEIHAQEGYTTRQITDMVGQMNWDRNVLQGNSNIAGTPYLKEEFKNGNVFYDGKYKVTQVPLRLNLYNDQFEFKDKNTVMAFADPRHIDKIVIENEIYIYIDKSMGAEVFGFVKKWNAKLPTVLTKMKIEFLNKEDPKPFEDTKPERFERAMDKHYIMKSKNEIVKVTSVKKLIKYLGTHTEELSIFAKEEKISAGDPEELAKLLEYYHELE